MTYWVTIVKELLKYHDDISVNELKSETFKAVIHEYTKSRNRGHISALRTPIKIDNLEETILNVEISWGYSNAWLTIQKKCNMSDTRNKEFNWDWIKEGYNRMF